MKRVWQLDCVKHKSQVENWSSVKLSEQSGNADNSERYVKVMNWIAQKSAQTLTQTGRLTVIVQDDGSSHTSHLAREYWNEWQQQGLYLFVLPPYCSEMNEIEGQWHQLKTHEIAGRTFNNEYDLATAIMHSMDH